MKISKFFILFLTLAAFLFSCGNDDVVNPPDPNESELITTMILNFTDTLTGQVSDFEFNDPDGTGGGAPTVFDTIVINSNSTYSVNIILLNRSVTPADTISSEVEEEGTAHQFFYFPNGINTNVAYEDFDTNGNPIGLQTEWANAAASSGSMQIILKHQPGIKPPAPGNVNIGETDIDVTFQTVVQ